MDAGVREILDLALRWVHVIAAIMWIGNSLLFNWLDRSLLPPGRRAGGALGEAWLLHSGGFYFVEKTMLVGQELPRPLHWFRWQAYTTWLSGAALLGVVYYASGGALLVDPAVANLTPAQAAAIGVGFLAGGWLLYDLLWSFVLPRWPAPAAAALSLALVLAAGYALTQLFSGRAAFLHLGAVMGTLMAGNVVMKIMPAQRQLVGAVGRGEAPDTALAERAKLHSIHNNYLTFPVVVLMLSSHFPGLYGHPRNGLLLGVLVLGGAAARHWLNVRFTEPRWLPALGATVAATLAALYLLAASGAPAPAQAVRGAGGASFAEAHAVIQKRCTVCHSASPADRTFGVAPAGVAFDTPEQIRARADRILARAVQSHTMPPGNRTWMTPGEREVLRRWIEGGARLEQGWDK